MITRAFLLVAALLTTPVQAAPITDEARSCYEWFSTLGFPDVKNLEWTEVWQGFWLQSEDKTFHAKTLDGFLIKEDDNTFTVFSYDLVIRRLTKSKPGTAVHERVAFEVLPFLPMAEEHLKALQNPSLDGYNRFHRIAGTKSEVFALSYFCWLRGEENLAAKLYAEADKQKTSHIDYNPQEQAIGMREALEIELGHTAMWDAVLRMGGRALSGKWDINDTLQPRAELLESFRRIVRVFPRSKHIERAKTTITMLERMVEEDKAHTSLTQQQIDQLPLEQRIAELIWMLRDQNGYQMDQPGSCNIFGYSDDNSAAHQLLKIGYPAAPALIEALTDDRFSRSVGFHRDFHFSHTILTIGDCAQQILSRLSGHNFYSRASTSGYM